MSRMITSDTPFRRIGGCSITAWRDVARKVESSISDDDLILMHDAAEEHSALCLSQCVKESTLGRDATAKRTKNPLGLMMLDGVTLASFTSWADAVREWRRRITDLTYKQGVYAPEDMTLSQFIVTYVGGPRCWTTGGNVCANGETWDGAFGGSIGLYLLQTIERVNAYIGDIGMATNPYKAPVFYALEKDFARFGLTASQAAKIANHRFTNRQGKQPMAIVLHIQEGNTKSSLGWWASGNADASSTVMVQKDGSLLSVIPANHGPWTNGDTNQPSAKGRALIAKAGGVNPNLVSLTIETEGFSGEKATDAAIETICWQITEWMNAYRLTKSDIYRHADLNSVSRAFCPGAYFDQVMTKLDSGTGSGGGTTPPVATWPNKPSWLPDDLVRVLFPEADPGGSRTAAWLRYCAETGRAPRRIAFHGTGSAQLIEFSDGMMIDASGKVVGSD